MTFREALEITQLLGVLAKFPSRNDAVVAKIAEQIASMCKSTAQAQRLIDEMTGGRFDEWPGPATLRGVYEELYPPSREYEPEWMSYKPTPTTCGVCSDTGAVQGGSDGNWGRCSCESGTNVDQTYIDELQSLLERGRELRARAKQRFIRKGDWQETGKGLKDVLH